MFIFHSNEIHKILKKKKVFPKIPISIEVTEYGNLRETTISNIHLLTLINSVPFKLHISLYLLEVF